MLPVNGAFPENLHTALIIGEARVLTRDRTDHRQQVLRLGRLNRKHPAHLAQLARQLNELVTVFPEHSLLPHELIQVVKNARDPLILVLVFDLDQGQ